MFALDLRHSQMILNSSYCLPVNEASDSKVGAIALKIAQFMVTRVALM